MDIDLILKLAAIMALIAIFILAVYTALSLQKALNVMERVSNNVNRLTEDISKSLHQLTNDVSNASVQLVTTTKKLENSADQFNNMLSPFTEMVASLHRKLAAPFHETAGYLSAITKTVNTFASYFIKKH